MPRTGRKQSSTGIYHVMLRGINRQMNTEPSPVHPVSIIAPSGKIAVDGKVGGKTEEFVKDGDWKQFENGIEKARYNGSRYPCADTLFGIHP